MWITVKSSASDCAP